MCLEGKGLVRFTPRFSLQNAQLVGTTKRMIMLPYRTLLKRRGNPASEALFKRFFEILVVDWCIAPLVAQITPAFRSTVGIVACFERFRNFWIRAWTSGSVVLPSSPAPIAWVSPVAGFPGL
jgi:hypothetical protein